MKNGNDSICLKCNQEYMAGCLNDRHHHVSGDCIDPEYENKRKAYWDEVNKLAKEDYEQAHPTPLKRMLDNLS